MTTQYKNTVTFLKRKRGEIKARVTKFHSYLLQAEAQPDVFEIQARIDSLISNFAKIYDIHNELLEQETNEQLLQQYSEEVLTMEDEYNRTLGIARKLIHKANTLSTDGYAQSVTSSRFNTQPIKLPEISLPRFDGAIENWPAFRDKFLARIHRNEGIPTVDKFQYLQSALTGRAARAVEAFETTENNYNVAWDILIKKYDNSRKTILRHLTMLHNIPKLQKDTPEALDDLVDTIQQHLRALKNLNQPIEHWDSIIIHLIINKISDNTIFQWETTLKDNKMPSYTTLLEFLEKRGNCANHMITPSPSDTHYSSKQPSYRTNQVRKQNFATTATRESRPVECPLCKIGHKIYSCPTFLNMSIKERSKNVSSLSLCHNCLRPGHYIKNCMSNSTCRKCHKKHHTLLHADKSSPPVASTEPSTSSQLTRQEENILENKTQITSLNTDVPTDDIIPTACVNVLTDNKTLIPCRTLLDTGSTANFITEDLANQLKVPKFPCTVPIGALNDLSTMSHYYLDATIASRHNGFQKKLRFLVIPRISNCIPQQQLNRKYLNIPKNIQLADPEFHKPSPVQMLIGTGTSLSILSIGQIKLSQPLDSDLCLQKTLLGWIIGGSLTTHPTGGKCYSTYLERDMNRFWEIEDGPVTRIFSQEEMTCEEHFKKTVSRNAAGRYVVALPFNGKLKQLGNSREIALRRLHSLERKFKRDPVLQTHYKAVIDEYRNLGHIRLVKGETEEGFYLPHHAVFKETSLTTKIRVVFDGSALSSSGISLNDTLMIGPTIQDDLFLHIIRFRLHNYVLTGDIEKMYRQVLVRDEDTKYQRILWRDENDIIRTYELLTVTFGLGPAPFLAIRTINQLANDEANRFPIASKILKRDLYVDDLLSGAKTIEEAINMRNEVINLLKLGGFNLRQIASNSPNLLEGISTANINLQLQDSSDPTLKTLGVYWNSQQDAIVYSVKPIAISPTITKRTIFSEIARIFDPLGLLNPVITHAKIFMQELWKLKLDWDESVPNDVNTRWSRFASQLILLNQLSFERKMLHNETKHIQLHGFCDASEKAYGAVIYLRSTDCHGNSKTKLYCAKSRVAPIKNVQTIPRLELCAALLLARLYNTVISAIPIVVNRTIFWTDSTITLHWIKKSPHILKTFVANRVAEIQSKTNADDWRHVRTSDNPADALSRGQLPSDFIKNPIWHRGPTWLSTSEDQWPITTCIVLSETPEIRKLICMSSQPCDFTLLSFYSSFHKLVRIVALCLRFKNCYRGQLSPKELENARLRIIKLIQGYNFKSELQALQKGEPVSRKSKLLTLNPFLDQDGIIRVGGRLQKADIQIDQKYPAILPKSHHITEILIQETHLDLLHAGVQATLYTMRQKYWLLDGRNQVRKILRKCIKCARAKPPAVEHVMGNLPKIRITEARPFCNTGVDYCGPFYIKERRRQNRCRVKVYVAIFVCLSVKAVHLELVSDLTTEGFLSALKRFIARRGRCMNIYSDNGTNFTGAWNELQELQRLLFSDKHNELVQNYLTKEGVNWNFSPPQSPHFGGLWEAAVKSFKHHLRRVAGNNLFTFEQFNTLTIEIEAVLNSRPLTPLSSDPNDLIPLTPAHFLIGETFTSIPEQDLSNIPCNRMSMWQHVQKIKQDFWVRWHKEYLNELTVRQRWTRGDHNIQKGSMVVLRDMNSPPLQWRIGRVLETYPGSDGVIRVVKVKTMNGVVKRCVRQLALLPVDPIETQT